MALGVLSISAGIPTLWSPYPLMNVIPGFLVGATPLNSPSLPFRTLALSLIAACPIALFFWLWVRPTSARTEHIPRRSKIFLVAVLVLSVAYFVASWEYGTKYQGLLHTIVLSLFNTAFALTCLLLWRSNQGLPRKAKVEAYHGILFCWLAWCAFPILGELA